MHPRLLGAALAALCLIAIIAAFCIAPWLGWILLITLAVLAFLYGPVCSPVFWAYGFKKPWASGTCAALAALCLMLIAAQPADARRARHVAATPDPVGYVVDDRYPHLRMPEAVATARAWKSGHRFSGDLAWRAGRHLGTNPTGWARVWCGKFLRMVVPRDPGPAFNVARNWKHYGSAAHGPVAGAIGVMPHHVGIVLGRCADGGVLLRSGNHNKTVGDGCYPQRRFIAFRA
jgi:hypothetical protein